MNLQRETQVIRSHLCLLAGISLTPPNSSAPITSGASSSSSSSSDVSSSLVNKALQIMQRRKICHIKKIKHHAVHLGPDLKCLTLFQKGSLWWSQLAHNLSLRNKKQLLPFDEHVSPIRVNFFKSREAFVLWFQM